ncbi:(2Fe-2S)-binding protein [Desulforamulus hydrothermalis]|uniref:BFD domain protein (2Fe-2S)-binding domain protein n=1 Tax=Desulforamulus hydrothermalis Lam5 = DSM 18033 TaxID=1121428 RepID=K8EEE0_9FIRM|nr:(2Fe-2S)-binding protein [Desulforamulus hydrothermalis]CCO07156.1 BFD domain protein (2Fe-2S)-binding domain protein [Desulforamulus hydrothermalis Lam5 = DSM 18033]SHG88860.1 BFD-like [2Fe-2S] binding domain-containing protein [Desulforamulus hydrothermalis Lam5 = DSM 18033]
MCDANQTATTVICRCEDITLEEVRGYIEQGITDLEQLKRLLRVGMGPCQGRTCTPLIVNELARATGRPVREIPLTVFRQPTTPVKLGVLAGGTEHE